MKRYIQAIVIKDSHILYGSKYDEFNSHKNVLPNTEITEGEPKAAALERIIHEILGVPFETMFKLNREAYGNTITFLVQANSELLDNENFLRERGFRWVSLGNKDAFSYNDKIQLRNLLDTLYEKHLTEPYIKSLENLISEDPSLGFANTYLIQKKIKLEHREFDLKTSSGLKFSFIFAALVLGILYDMFFSTLKFGISVPIYGVLLSAAFLYTNKECLKEIKTIGFFFLILTFVLSSSFAVHSNIFLLGLNSLALPFLFVSSFLLIKHREIEWHRIGFISVLFSRIFPKSFENFFKPFGFLKISLKREEKKKLSPTSKHILTGLLISLPLLLLIVPLLASADSVFSYYISNFYTIFSIIKPGKFIWDAILITFISLFIFGLLWSFNYPLKKQRATKETKGVFETVTVITVLVVINLVYLMFTLVQSSYLYGSGESILPNGFTYAEYARRGFFELVLVTIINFTIFTLSQKFTKKGSVPLSSILRAVHSILVLFTLNMLYSANFKMIIYENAFGYTYLRVFVQIFLLLLLLLFIIALAGIWNKRVPTVKASIVVTLVLYVAVNFINVDGIIARKNIERFRETKKIDVNYLTQLSDDALPELVKFVEAKEQLSSAQYDIKEYLKFRKEQLGHERKWYEYNYSVERAKMVVESIK